MGFLKKYLCEYRAFILSALDGEGGVNYEQLLHYQKSHIEFFQHERFIHLIVTFIISLFLVLSVGASILSRRVEFALLSFLFLCLVIPYIKHYYFLENHVQELYRDYDRICERVYAWANPFNKEKS